MQGQTSSHLHLFYQYVSVVSGKHEDLPIQLLEALSATLISLVTFLKVPFALVCPASKSRKANTLAARITSVWSGPLG